MACYSFSQLCTSDSEVKEIIMMALFQFYRIAGFVFSDCSDYLHEPGKHGEGSVDGQEDYYHCTTSMILHQVLHHTLTMMIAADRTGEMQKNRLSLKGFIGTANFFPWC